MMGGFLSSWLPWRSTPAVSDSSQKDFSQNDSSQNASTGPGKSGGFFSSSWWVNLVGRTCDYCRKELPKEEFTTCNFCRSRFHFGKCSQIRVPGHIRRANRNRKPCPECFSVKVGNPLDGTPAAAHRPDYAKHYYQANKPPETPKVGRSWRTYHDIEDLSKLE